MFCAELEIVRFFEKSQIDHSSFIIIREKAERSELVGEKVVVILACLLAEGEEKFLAVRVWETAAKNFDQGKEDFSSVVHGYTGFTAQEIFLQRNEPFSPVL